MKSSSHVSGHAQGGPPATPPPGPAAQGDQDEAPRYAHAVVLGGGIAGLLAARVLRDHFERVTLVERDDLETGDVPRRGVPQGRHAHGLLAGGAQVLERLFPGLREELVADGALLHDVSATAASTVWGATRRASRAGSRASSSAGRCWRGTCGAAC